MLQCDRVLEQQFLKQLSEALSNGFNAMNESVRGYVPKVVTSKDVTSALASSVAQVRFCFPGERGVILITRLSFLHSHLLSFSFFSFF